MKKARTKVLAVGLSLAGLALAMWLLQGLSIGYFFPETIREQLSHPVTVLAIKPEGLRLADGRFVAIPWIERLPLGMPILEDATAQGVEVDDAGYVFGLLRIHHWCGNDPVRKHLARVNLSNLLVACGAETTVPLPKGLLGGPPEVKYTKYGWDMGDYVQSDCLSRFLEAKHGAEAARRSPAP